MKERYRRIPIELTLVPKYEELNSDEKLVYLTLIISARQTPPGIYDGGMKSLEYETSLPSDRLKSALKKLEKAHMIEQVTGGGWWVRDTFRAQCCNADYARAAIRHLKEKWPAITPRFLEANSSTLNKYEIPDSEKVPPRTDHRPPSHPPQSPTDSVAVPGSDSGTKNGSKTGTGGRGFKGEGGVAASRIGPFDATSAASPGREKEKGKVAGNGEIPEFMMGILHGLSSDQQIHINNQLDKVRAGEISRSAAREGLKESGWFPAMLVARLIPERGSPEDWLDG